MPYFAYKHTAFAIQPCKGFSLVNCPGNTADGAKKTRALLQAFENGTKSDGSLVKHIGDGESDLDTLQIWPAWREFEQELASSETFCMVISGHGKEESGMHYTRLDQRHWVRTDLLLRGFQSQSTKTRMMSIFLHSCNSNFAQSAVNVLPKGSVLVTTSDIDFDSDMERLTNALAKNWPKDARAVDLFYFYLVKSLRNRFMPIISVAHGNKYVLDDMLHRHCGRQIGSTAVDEVSTRVGEGERLKAISAKVGFAQNEWDIDASEYGSSLALLLAEQS